MTDSVNGTVNYTYDELGQLTGETTANGTVTYTYDTRGNRIGMNQGGIISQYTYDASNRLVSQTENIGTAKEQQTNYTYDNNGNLILRQMGQLSDAETAGSEQLLLTGQTEQIPNTIQGASMVWYEYNSFGQLSGVSTDTGMQASYTYDATGRRASKTVNGVEKRHLWNGDRISAESDANDAITDTYYQLGSLSAHQAGNNLYYYIYDGHGSVVGMKEWEMFGDTVEMYHYDAFGNQKTSEVNVHNPFRYCGEYQDLCSGLIYLRNRYYDPSIGRFITEDPAKDGLNWYVYCGNNPVMFVDPLGLALKLIGTGDEVSQIWGYLNELTDDALVLTQDRVETGDGVYELLDSYTVTIDTEIDGLHPVGTSMIRRIIDNLLVCYVEMTTSGSQAKPIMLENASNPQIGTGGKIYFNPNYALASVLTEYNEEGEHGIRYENMPSEIVLGHELIHVLRYMGGNRIYYNKSAGEGYGQYTYRDANGMFGQQGKMRTEKQYMEELATTGISYTRPDGSYADAANWITTENALRKEHGYGRRVKY